MRRRAAGLLLLALGALCSDRPLACFSLDPSTSDSSELSEVCAEQSVEPVYWRVSVAAECAAAATTLAPLLSRVTCDCAGALVKAQRSDVVAEATSSSVLIVENFPVSSLENATRDGASLPCDSWRAVDVWRALRSLLEKQARVEASSRIQVYVTFSEGINASHAGEPTKISILSRDASLASVPFKAWRFVHGVWSKRAAAASSAASPLEWFGFSPKSSKEEAWENEDDETEELEHARTNQYGSKRLARDCMAVLASATERDFDETYARAAAKKCLHSSASEEDDDEDVDDDARRELWSYARELKLIHAKEHEQGPVPSAEMLLDALAQQGVSEMWLHVSWVPVYEGGIDEDNRGVGKRAEVLLVELVWFNPADGVAGTAYPSFEIRVRSGESFVGTRKKLLALISCPSESPEDVAMCVARKALPRDWWRRGAIRGVAWGAGFVGSDRDEALYRDELGGGFSADEHFKNHGVFPPRGSSERV